LAQSVRTRDIAEKLGIARPTVSTILSGGKSNTRVSDDLRQRVLTTARQMGYRPNAAAKAIGTGRFGSVGLVVSAADPGRSSVPGQLLFGTSVELERHGMHLSIAALDDRQLTDESFMPRVLRESAADGLLINYHKLIPARMIELIEDYRIPSIWLNVKRDHDCVYFDDLGAGRRATQALLEAGHRRIAFASHHWEGKDAHYSEHDRRDGYLRAMREAGLPSEVIERIKFGGDHLPARLIDHWTERLGRADRPTGVVAYGSAALAPIIRAADRLGLRVPDDLSVGTFGQGTGHHLISLDTMVHDEAEMGRVAINLLLTKIQSPRTRLAPRVLEMDWRPIGSVQRPTPV